MFIAAPAVSLPYRTLLLVAETGCDRLASVDQRRHRLHRLVEHGTLGAVELNVDDALDALGTDHRRHADVKILHAVFAVEIGGARQDALLVLEIALRHRDRGG